MIGRLNHVAIAVPDLASAAAQYHQALGADVGLPVDLPEHGVSVIFVMLANTKIEFVTPFGAESPLKAFLNRNPVGGIHHICYEVPNLAEARDRLLAQGARVLGTAKIGAHGKPVLFLHPKDFTGTLIELEEQ